MPSGSLFVPRAAGSLSAHEVAPRRTDGVHLQQSTKAAPGILTISRALLKTTFLFQEEAHVIL